MSTGSAAAGTAGSSQSNRTQHVEFVVKPQEDLHLEGPQRKILRVTKGEQYSCQMLKTQAFQCLFRHYAKHNGLKKEDLEFFFTDELKPDETPESVHLMPHDEIWVQRKKNDVEELEDEDYPDLPTRSDRYSSLLPEGSLAGEHSDVKFILTEDRREVHAHKAILSIGSEYFCAMFKSGGMRECKESTFHVKDYNYDTFSRMIEFIYTNYIRDIDAVEHSEMMPLLTLANEYVLADMKKFCENASKKKLNKENVFDFLRLSHTHHANNLTGECLKFIQENFTREQLQEGAQKNFSEEEIGSMGLLLLAAQRDDDESSGLFSSRKRRRSGAGSPDSRPLFPEVRVVGQPDRESLEG